MACAQPFLIKNPHFNEYGYHQFWKQYIEVPCGWCLNCRVDRQNWLSDACDYEFKHYNYIGAFVTFTYDDNHIFDLLNVNENDFSIYNSVPEINNKNKELLYSLRRDDLRKFMKRVRSKINYLYDKHNIKNIDLCRKDYKSIASGEYGDKFGRPHYHVVFFGLDWQYCKELFESCWQNGLIDSKPIQSGCFNYITKYITKQVHGDYAKQLYDDKGIERPFISHSIGLGKGLILEQYDFIKNNNLCYKTLNDTLRPIPIYYRNHFFKFRPRLSYSCTANNMNNSCISPDLSPEQWYKSNGTTIKYSLKKMNDFRRAQALLRHQELERKCEDNMTPIVPLIQYEKTSFDTEGLAYKALGYTVVDGDIIPF